MPKEDIIEKIESVLINKLSTPSVSLSDIKAYVNISSVQDKVSVTEMTPLSIAVSWGHDIEIIEYLLKYGADVHATNRIDGKNVLELARSRGASIEVIKVLECYDNVIKLTGANDLEME